MILKNLEKQLKDAVKNWDFEKATELRDQIIEINKE
jgi:protein-arginine kinase activator protein McsA